MERNLDSLPDISDYHISTKSYQNQHSSMLNIPSNICTLEVGGNYYANVCIEKYTGFHFIKIGSFSWKITNRIWKLPQPGLWWREIFSSAHEGKILHTFIIHIPSTNSFILLDFCKSQFKRLFYLMIDWVFKVLKEYSLPLCT